MQRAEAWCALGGTAVGSALVYLFDPQSGRRRRHQLAQRGWYWARASADGLSVSARDLVHRTQGAMAELRGRMVYEPTEDAVLRERVRSVLGHLCSHPGAIDVSVSDGCVWLSGPILTSELRPLLRGVRRVRGVSRVENLLEPHKSRGHVPALQGGRSRPHQFELLQQHWAPAPRVLVASGALAASSWALRQQLRWAPAIVFAGGAVFLRAATNLPFRRLVGFGAGQRAVDVVKELHIEAPVEEVFAFFSSPENFPRFMTHVKEVKKLGDGRYHWKVEGPVGVCPEWDAEVTVYERNETFGWRSLPGALVQSAGVIRFTPSNGGTHVSLRMSYNPPAGALGHALARLFRRDPKHELDDDLLRLKSLLENGRATGRYDTVDRQQLFLS